MQSTALEGHCILLVHRQKLSSGFSQGPAALDMPAGSEMIRTGSSGAAGSAAPAMHGIADRLESAKQKVKPQKAPNRFAAAALEPARPPKKRKAMNYSF